MLGSFRSKLLWLLECDLVPQAKERPSLVLGVS